MKINPGDQMPDIAFRDSSNREVKLSGFRGKKVVVSFHPLAFTPVCAQQMLDLEKNASEINELNGVAIGVSVDSPFSKAAWQKELAIANVIMASDFSREASEALGILRAEGFSERAVYVVDEDGRVLFSRLYPIGQVPEIGEILAAL